MRLKNCHILIYREFRRKWKKKTIISDFSRLNRQQFWMISEEKSVQDFSSKLRQRPSAPVHQSHSLQRRAVLASLPPRLDGVQRCSAACRLQPLQPALHRAADQYLNGSDGWGDAAVLHTDTTHHHQARPTRLLGVERVMTSPPPLHLTCILKN